MMKKASLCLGISAMLLFSCQSDDSLPVPDDRKDIQLTRSELEMAASGNKFAFDFFQSVLANEEKDNVFISPLSASVVLSMTTNGAVGETLEEMKAALGFEDYSLEEMNTYYKKLIYGLLTVDHSTTLGIANSIWIREGFSVKQSFIDLNKEIYDAEVKSLDFNSSQAVSTINQWCSDKTNKRITKILESISPDARLFLMNALYFKGTWTSKFDKKNTSTEDFTTLTGQKNKVDMMRQECGTPYASDQGVQIVELPYGNQAFSMVILLPDEDGSLDDVVEQLTFENWNLWMKRLATSQVDIKLPKFKLEYDRDLKEDLQNMGMNTPFVSSLADFSNMSTAEELYIGLVKQSTFVEVNEEGTEAAAVTIVGMETSAMPEPLVVPFHVNRPFIYVIKEKSTEAILFMGKIGSL